MSGHSLLGLRAPSESSPEADLGLPHARPASDSGHPLPVAEALPQAPDKTQPHRTLQTFRASSQLWLFCTALWCGSGAARLTQNYVAKTLGKSHDFLGPLFAHLSSGDCNPYPSCLLG